MSDRTSDTSTIERELEATRARLGLHLDELTSRLSPGQLLDEGLSYVRDGQGAEFVRNLGAQVRDNPLPVALAGISLAWLAFASSRQPAGSRSRALIPYEGEEHEWNGQRESMIERARRAGEAVTRSAGETEDAFRGRVADARAGVLGVTRQAQETVAAFADRVQQALDRTHSSVRSGFDRASDWRDDISARGRRASAAAGEALDRGRHYASSAGEYASRTGGYVSRTGSDLGSAIVENPLLLAAVGATAGALLGALLPHTRQEEEWVGPAAADAMQSARDMAGDVLDRGQRVAGAAAHAALDAGQKAAESEGPKLGGEKPAERDNEFKAGRDEDHSVVIPPTPAPERRDLH